MKERRKYQRVLEEDGIAVKIVDVPEDASKSGTFLRLTKDVSQRGLRFCNAEEIPVATPLKIHLVLDMPRKIITHIGVVRWAERASADQPYHIGVEFTDTPDPDMQVWSHYIDNRLQIPARS